MAKYFTYMEKAGITNGTIIWAFAFEETTSKAGTLFHQKPIRGRLASDTGDIGIQAFNPASSPRAFVPFKKNSDTEYAWSKAVGINTRCYADTEAEAVEGYNQLIEENMSWYRDKLKALEAMKI